MTSKIFKRIIPMVFGGLAMLVFAMPMTASAHDWNHRDWGHRDWGHRGWDGHDWDHDGDHHDHGRHVGWYHHDRDDDDCDARPGYGYYQPNYYAPPAYRAYQQPFAYGYGNNPRMNYLRQEWSRAEARHQNALASGNRRAARMSSKRLYQLDRDMGATGYRPYANGYGGPNYGNGYYNNDYNNGYYNGGQAFGPLGQMFGLW